MKEPTQTLTTNPQAVRPPGVQVSGPLGSNIPVPGDSWALIREEASPTPVVSENTCIATTQVFGLFITFPTFKLRIK